MFLALFLIMTIVSEYLARILDELKSHGPMTAYLRAVRDRGLRPEKRRGARTHRTLTRPIQHLTVVHARPLPAALGG